MRNEPGNEPYMTSPRISHDALPRQWARYDLAAVSGLLIEAKSAASVLNRMPRLPQWIEQAHEEQLRLEAVGTSRIEGAEFTEREQEEALAPGAESRVDLTRSQRQLRSANAAYRRLGELPADRPVTSDLILGIHRRMVTGCDDDHCEPGAIRSAGANVTFGMPRCRGVEGGGECSAAFNALVEAANGEFRRHDRIVQAMAAHYHIGAMHPFDDGNGRAARALEAFMLRAAGVNNMVMVSLSNYYYERKDEYLAALRESRLSGHNLTPFLTFALPAVADRCNALAEQIIENTKRTLYRQFATSLFGRLRSPRRRLLADRQLRILNLLLDGGPLDLPTLTDQASVHYRHLKFAERALLRDLIGLLELSAIALSGERIAVNLDWPQQSEADLLERYERMPSAASAEHPAMAELSRLLGRRR